MNPDILSPDSLATLSEVDTTGINLNPTHLLWTTILVLVVSHFGAKYLMSITPKGYWFWFTILNIVIGLMFM